MFRIYDWTGRDLQLPELDSFEDAWDYIRGDLTDKLGLTEEDYQEYFVDRG
jgi:hypothetical protein